MISLFWLPLLIIGLNAQNYIRLSEEPQIGYELDITHHLSIPITNEDEISILNQQSHGVSAFKITKESSAAVKLVVTSRVDREDLCPNSRFQPEFSVITGSSPIGSLGNEEPCLISIKISAGEKIETLVVEVLDINDNVPLWPISGNNPRFTHNIEFRDDEPVGTEVILPLAEDADILENAQITYSLSSTDPGGLEFHDTSWSDFFSLDKQDSQLILRSRIVLDREFYPKGWKLYLIATDNGRPEKKSNKLPLVIKINDLNDNSPKFPLTEYINNDLRESTSLNEVILRVEASDPDLGKNGQIGYTIETNDENIKGFFEINRNGEIRLKKRLQVDQVTNEKAFLPTVPISFKVKATDMAESPYAQFSEVPVTIKIQDVNDESPNIEVHPLKPKSLDNELSTSPNGDKINLYLEENKSNALIALIQISDSDFEGKDIITCTLHGINEKHFQLEKTSVANEYKLKSLKEWDRERVPNIDLFINCQDSVSHTVQKQLSIKILDVNDNAPSFEESIYKFQVKEDDGERSRDSFYPRKTNFWQTESGKAGVSAHDPDDPMIINSKLKYSIRPKPGQEGLHTEELFEIEPDTGLIYVTGSLDRELQQFHTFMVHVEDLGSPALSASVQVDVELIDVNDNPPSFIIDHGQQSANGGYSFSVEENLFIGSLVGQLSAIDADTSPEINPGRSEPGSDASQKSLGKFLERKDGLYYVLEKCKDSENFRIDPVTGKISIKRYLDREKQAMYSFKAYVLDGNSKYQRIKSANPEASLREEIDKDPEYRVHIVATNVFITVLDLNDNAPKFIQPNFTDHLIHLDPLTPSGTKILTVQASDPDDSLNGKISYNLINGNIPDLFSIYSHTGDLHLQSAIPTDLVTKTKRIFDEISSHRLNNPDNKKMISQLEEAYPILMVKLEACDMGEVPKCTTLPNLQIQLRHPEEDFNLPSVSNFDQNSGFWNRNYDSFGSGRTFSENLAIGLSIFFSIIVILIALIICFVRLKSRKMYQDTNPEQFKYVSAPHSQTLLLKDPAKFPGGVRATDQMMNAYETVGQPGQKFQIRGQPNFIYDGENFMTLNSRTNRMMLVKPNGYQLQNYKLKPYKGPTGNLLLSYDTLRSQNHLDNSQNEYQTIPIKSGTADELLSQTNLSEETMSCGSIEVFNINKNSAQYNQRSMSNEKTELKPGEPLPANLVLPKSTFV